MSRTDKFAFVLSRDEHDRLLALADHELRSGENWLRWAVVSAHDGRSRSDVGGPGDHKLVPRDVQVQVRLHDHERSAMDALATKRDLAVAQWLRLKIGLEYGLLPAKAKRAGKVASSAGRSGNAGKAATQKPAAKKAAANKPTAKKPVARKPAPKPKRAAGKPKGRAGRGR